MVRAVDLRAGNGLLERDDTLAADAVRDIARRAGRVQNNVKLLQFLDGWAGAQTNVHIELFDLCANPVRIPLHLLLAGRHAAAEDRAAKLAGLFKQRDLMAAYGRDSRSFHARGAAAYDADLQGSVRFFKVIEFHMAACRVDRAADLLLRHHALLPAAGKAGNAAADLFGLAHVRLHRPVRVAEQLTRKADHVGIAVRHELVAVIRVAERMAVDDRDRHGFLDRLRSVDRPALGIVHRVEACAGALLNALAEIQRRNARALKLDRHLDAFLQLASALDPFVNGIADKDREAFAALLLDGGNDGKREAHTVFKAAAPAIDTLVQIGRHKLGDQIPVRGMQFNAVKAGLLDAPCGFGELVDHVHDLFGGHGADGLSLLLRVLIDDLMARAPGQLYDHIRRGHGIVARNCTLAARMLELNNALCAILMHAFRKARKTRNEIIVVRDKSRHGRPAGCAVRRRCAHDDESGAAFCDLAVMMDVTFADRAVRIG
ncbi:unknown [Clostridium sp. CAG:1024]|nr:unknown [Clostridium sp. CAG:1024]